MNLFERLYCYREKAGKHERENYLTELLAGVLEHDHALCCYLCEKADLQVLPGTRFRIRTQVSYSEGQPDIVIDSHASGLFLLIECKLEAGEGDKQLQRYYAIAEASKAKNRAVIFLTKYYEPARKIPATYLRWHELHKVVAQNQTSVLNTLFCQYLSHNRLHLSMSFTTADLLTLEQISATTAKMDEVLDSIEWKFRGRWSNWV